MKNLQTSAWIGLGLTILVQGMETDPRVAEFRQPPPQTRPWCYWYWMNGNIGKDGITKDLEAMAKVGIGTAFIGNIGGQGPGLGPVKVLSDPWWDMMTHAVREGGRTGVDLGVFNSPGWSQSGGPWIKPQQAMRYIIQSETVVKGPQKFSAVLAVPKQPFMDLTVLAFPRPSADGDNLATRQPDGTCAKGDVPARLFDRDPASVCTFAANGDAANPTALVLDFKTPFTARSLTLTPAPEKIKIRVQLDVSDDGSAWRPVRSFEVDRSNSDVNVGPMIFGAVCVVFPETTGRHWRVVFPGPAGKFGLAEIDLSAAARTEHFVDKQLGKMYQQPVPAWDFYAWPAQPALTQAALAIQPKQVLDLSSKMAADGTLTWEVPDGEWVIQRLGLTPTNTKNSPASPEATGLECDKMSKPHIAAHFDAHLGELLRRLPEADRKAFKYCVADSYEMGSQNWTDGLGEVFKSRYGYDPLPYLTCLSGRVVGTPEMTDRFLWDLRRLVADEVADGYVGGLREVANKNGLKLWLENYGHWGFPSESLLYGKNSDMVGGEFWFCTGDNLGSVECRLASSSVHIYGKNICFAEAFTSQNDFKRTPAQLKTRGDNMFAQGINHFVFHVYVHQPDDSSNIITPWFGLPLHRKNAWFFEAKSWVDYLRRCQYLLQQGRYVADVAYFCGEDAPLMNGALEPALPAGYSYDFINGDAIMNRITIKDGRFTLPDGLSYKLLVLPPVKTMRPETLAKLQTLVEQGGAIYGQAPERSPSLKNFPACDEQVRAMANGLWAMPDKGAPRAFRQVGLGRVFTQGGLEAALQALACAPDLSDGGGLRWIHRKTSDGEIYFVSNQLGTQQQLAPVFRVDAKAQPAFWNPLDGSITTCGLFSNEAGGVRVPLALEPGESRFVVFAKSDRVQVAGLAALGKPEPALPAAAVVSDQTQATLITWQNQAYDVTLPNNKALRVEGVELPQPQVLASAWQTTFLEGTAGTAQSRTVFQFKQSPAAGWRPRVMLDLGPVSNMARVVLNGMAFDTLWCAPYRVDITAAIRDGDNTLEVFVTGTTGKRLSAKDPAPAGLPGPIRVLVGAGIPLARE
jgi:hypothetical protein